MAACPSSGQTHRDGGKSQTRDPNQSRCQDARLSRNNSLHPAMSVLWWRDRGRERQGDREGERDRETRREGDRGRQGETERGRDGEAEYGGGESSERWAPPAFAPQTPQAWVGPHFLEGPGYPRALQARL